nr:ATP-grasp domain-containing protein [Paenibacillus sp. UNC451MF]
MIIEVGDGQVSGLPSHTQVEGFYLAIRTMLSSEKEK